LTCAYSVQCVQIPPRGRHARPNSCSHYVFLHRNRFAERLC
jgi:hypothetical protein